MNQEFGRCVMLGLGYIGLPTAAVLARRGTTVVGVDVKPAIVEAVNAGECPIVEPGLPELVAEMVKTRRLSARGAPVAADVFVIAVPTPFEGGYKPDLSHVEAATRSLAPVLDKGNLVILESTSPVGTTEQVARWLEVMRPDLTFSRRGMTGDDCPDVLVAHCPERILPGNMLRELVENDRVIGGVCPRSGERGWAFYQTFVKGECVVTDARTAELCKLTENAFRDVNIAFANELATICADSGIDVWNLIELANRHPRVNILQPGPGVGGHCIAVDPWFIVSQVGDKARLIREARWINSARPRQVVRTVLDRLNGGGIGSIACFGLSYKADIGDLRESPAVEIVAFLAKELHFHHPEIALQVVEPHLRALPEALSAQRCIRLVDIEAALGADLLVMLVDHREFRAIPAERVAGKAVIDTRGVWVRSQDEYEQALARPVDAPSPRQ
jgi:UDP-N-acetyl-D-mannosaminuronic acid dehydrogenase